LIYHPIKLLTLLSLLATIAACAPSVGGGTQAATQADIDAIDQLRSAYEAAYNAQNAAAVAGFRTDDTLASLPNEAPTTVQDAIQSNLQATFDQFEAEIWISSEELQVTGDWAFDAGTVTQALIPKGESEAMERHFSYILILKRQADASWKIARSVSRINSLFKSEAVW